jgi:DNA-binding CsgD family transcriptional regulator
MPLQKSIVIGCDDTVTLSAVLKNIRPNSSFAYNVISAARTADLLGIVRSLSPDLVILCFRNNQLVLNNFTGTVKTPALPIMCLGRKSESDALRWNSSQIVFTSSLDHVHERDYLTARIQSILLLGVQTAEKAPAATTLAEAAMQRHVSATGSSDLSRYVMELDQKVEVLAKVKDRIAGLYPDVNDSTRAELMSIVNSIKASANDTKLWDDFKVYFDRTNPGFLMTLANRHPELTPMDLKYCCYLKMNMSNDDIRSLLGINQESVRTHKYRLKKKMDLPRDQDLLAYLRSVDKPSYI